jgi:hypothetical protein
MGKVEVAVVEVAVKYGATILANFPKTAVGEKAGEEVEV